MKELSLETRICECCGSNELQLVRSNRGCIKTLKETYIFPVYVVLCCKCGFCFNSPCPKKDDLEEFYADSLPICEGLPLAYSVDARIEIIKKYNSKRANCVEVGGNIASEFHSKLSNYVASIQNVELNKQCCAKHKSINALPRSKVDMIIHYDVLEHIPNVKDFLCSCYNALRDGGIMVCEVPDVRLYPRNLMLLSNVHLNHFSVTTLSIIAKNCGFKLLEIGHLAASRPFSFVSVFQKDRSKTVNNHINPFEYLDTLSCLREGIIQINRFMKHIQYLQNKITNLGKEGKKITFWCVTDLMQQLLDGFELPETVIVVDSDPKKSRHLEDNGILVFQPDDCLKHINESELLVIFSPRNKANILEWIQQKIGRQFNPAKLDVVASGFYGEPLQV